MADLQYVKGLEVLKAALNALPKNIGRNVIAKAAAIGAAVIKEKAISLAPTLQGVDRHNPPRVTGMLKAAIYQKKIPELSNDFVATTFVGVREGKQKGKFAYAVKTSAGTALVDAFYWKWLEFGHFYVPPTPWAQKGIKGIAASRRKNAIASGSAIWVKPQPFMRPAFNSTKDQAIKAIVDYLAERIPKEARKLGAKNI